MTPEVNITVLAPYQVYPAKTGGQKCIAGLYEYLSQRVPVSIVSTKNNEFPKEAAAHFFPLLGNSKLRYINPFLFVTLKKLFQKKKTTHLILEHPYYGWLGIFLKWFTNVKLVIHSHNIEGIRFKTTGKWWWRLLFHYEKLVHRHADINFFITEEDRNFALEKFRLDASKCHIITYGFDQDSMPSADAITEAKKTLRDVHGISKSEKIIFFNGTLDYKPNLDAVNTILNEINPRLLKKAASPYRIIICGKGLPASYDNLKAYESKNIIYAGFVEDIGLYFKGADCFINPVIDGGGIKTKLVEALGFNLSCISTNSGSIGVNTAITGKKLQIVPDGDWESFTNAIFDVDEAATIPAPFFKWFYWGHISEQAADIMKNN